MTKGGKEIWIEFDRDFVFQSDECIGESQKHEPLFADFTRLVAMRDPQLGSAILKPVFSGTSWLHHMTRPSLDRNLIMGAAAWSDPDWAMKKVLELSEELGAEDDVYRLQLICSLVSDIEKILQATR